MDIPQPGHEAWHTHQASQSIVIISDNDLITGVEVDHRDSRSGKSRLVSELLVVDNVYIDDTLQFLGDDDLVPLQRSKEGSESVFEDNP